MFKVALFAPSEVRERCADPTQRSTAQHSSTPCCVPGYATMKACTYIF